MKPLRVPVLGAQSLLESKPTLESTLSTAASLQAAFDLGGCGCGCGCGLQAAALATAGQRIERNRAFMIGELDWKEDER
jgi:hypothetical protein